MEIIRPELPRGNFVLAFTIAAGYKERAMYRIVSAEKRNRFAVRGERDSALVFERGFPGLSLATG
jgi:hypothetical protein